jgi:hypothetical protein
LSGAEHPIAVAVDRMDPGAVLPDQSDIVLFPHAHDAVLSQSSLLKNGLHLLVKIEKPFAVIERGSFVGKSTYSGFK